VLIEFSVGNFRSFREPHALSMVASTVSGHDTNTFDPKLIGFRRFLRSAGIYGPNAAGKTNLLLALQFVQGFVVNSASAAPGRTLPYQPFKLSKATRDAPSTFQVTLVQNEIRYEYGFSMNATQICDEWLVEYVNPRGRTIFERRFDEKKRAYEWHFSSFLKGQRSVWRDATRPEVLFLSRATQLNSAQLLPVYEWFQKRLVVVVGISTMNPNLTLQLLSQPEGKEKLLPFLKEADLGITGVEVKREKIPQGAGQMFVVGSGFVEPGPTGAPENVVRLTFSHGQGKDTVGFDISEESAGTQALFRTAGAWLNVLANGEVLLIDEIDTSLHPKLVRFLIGKFHSKESNPKNAQLIFTTHNTSLLDQEMFRRDQFWFVEKNREGSSNLYPLTDFKPRNDEALERWYMRGKYGALPMLGQNGR
jgi:uncharacterized protein